ncbi:AMP-binding protein [Parasalinivibrio latis]|uniref:AMP-binding protein n=1 Tax=Parasalinivibrio latis TaxID=2952610 RepID=UPI0030DE9667
MMYLNDDYFSEQDFASAAVRFASMPVFQNCSHHRYAVCIPDTYLWLSLCLFLKREGSSVLPVHPDMPREAAEKLARKAGCHHLFYHSLEPIGLDGGKAPVPGGELYQMSSGTTGEPKCIARSWQSIERELESYVSAFAEPSDMTPVIACPVTHSYGLIAGFLVALKRGQEPVVINNLNPKYILRRIKTVEKPLLYSSPAMLNTMAMMLPQGNSIHAAMTSGTVLPAGWFTAIKAKVINLFQQYGCSEAGCIAVNPRVGQAADIGYLLPHFSLVSPDAGGDTGEIVIRGEEGLIHTRDLGRLNPDGMMVFASRLDDTINVAGLNVYPQDIEDVVMAMPGIEDAVVIRRSDRYAGERAALMFSSDNPVEIDDLRAWCQARLAGFQMPTVFEQVSHIPRQANGKVSRREVAALYDAGKLTYCQSHKEVVL